MSILTRMLVPMFLFCYIYWLRADTLIAASSSRDTRAQQRPRRSSPASKPTPQTSESASNASEELSNDSASEEVSVDEGDSFHTQDTDVIPGGTKIENRRAKPYVCWMSSYPY